MTEPEKVVRTVRRRRMVLAVLSAGLVLGVGVTATTAAWNDSEFATGSVAASVFDTESQGSGDAGYSSHTSAPGAVLKFSAAGLSRGASGFATLRIRTTAATTVAGTVVLTSSAVSGALAPVLVYRAVVAPVGGTCEAARFVAGATFLAGSATAYSAIDAVGNPAVPFRVGAASAGPQEVCFEVQVLSTAENTYQGKTAGVTWGFTATSDL